jgi:hypothetical protein
MSDKTKSNLYLLVSATGLSSSLALTELVSIWFIILLIIFIGFVIHSSLYYIEVNTKNDKGEKRK